MAEPRWDVAIVGGGPAGLAVAIGAAQRGLSTIVLERHRPTPDKACGEGVLPPALAALDVLGARPHTHTGRIEGIRYLQEDGTAAEARLPGDGGLAIRRTMLSATMEDRARTLGVELRTQQGVRGHRRTEDRVELHTDHERIEARILVAADGLASPIRAREGLDRGLPARRRYGLRQHFACAPWTPFVEVHLSEGCEAYVTPSGPGQLGVALLWDDAALDGPRTMNALLARFPKLADRLVGKSALSAPRGAGPLARRAHRVVGPRIALVGDAAGYVDAITGEGLSVALVTACALADCLPDAIHRRGDPRALDPYARTFARLFRRYRWSTEALLAIARRPALRRRVIRLLARQPRLFELILGAVVG